MTTTEFAQIQLRAATAAAWTATNPTLGPNEPGWESDTKRLKFGDGVTAWNALPYFYASDPEVIRDTMASALVAGANVTITPNDAGDTITIAASGSGGGSAGLTKIAETELPAAAATISFASIPATFSSLRLVLTARSNAAANQDTVRLFANGDTTLANYKNKTFYGSTATGYGGSAEPIVGYIAGNTATAGDAGVIECTIPHYAKTTFRKNFQSQFYQPGVPLSGIANAVRLNTAAITDLQLALLTGQFMAGSIATLYGMI